jgi:hypothetical protein
MPLGEEPKTLAETQYRQQRDKNICGNAMPIAERQNQSAKPYRPSSETTAILLINKAIRRRSILPMVGKTLPMVGDPKISAKTLRHWQRIKYHARRHDDISRGAKTMIEDSKMLAENQSRWSTSRIRRSLLSNYCLSDSNDGLCHITIVYGTLLIF